MRTDFGRMDRVPSEPSLQEEQGQHISTPFSVPPIGEHDFEGPSYKKNQQQQKTNKQTNKHKQTNKQTKWLQKVSLVNMTTQGQLPGNFLTSVPILVFLDCFQLNGELVGVKKIVSPVTIPLLGRRKFYLQSPLIGADLRILPMDSSFLCSYLSKK